MPRAKEEKEWRPKYRDRVVTGVRKVCWDEKWHVLYETGNNGEGWDRVDRPTALRMMARIEKVQKPKPKPKKKAKKKAKKRVREYHEPTCPFCGCTPCSADSHGQCRPY